MVKKRINWVDWARFLAIIFVVFCHAIEVEYWPVRFGEMEVGFASWLFQNIIFTLGRIGVPLFLMITGTLMLGREYPIKEYFIKTVLPLILTTEIWIVLNFLFVNYSSGLNIKPLLKQMLFLDPAEMVHMWYMPMIIGFYIVIPFLSKAIKDYSIAEISVPLAFAFVAFFAIPIYNDFAGEIITSFPDIHTIINTSFLGGIYAIYLILGFYIGKKNLCSKLPFWLLVLIGVLSFALNTIFAHYFLQHELFHTDVFAWYSSPFILVLCVVLFELVKRFAKKENRFVQYVARVSFGIFLLHNFFLYFITQLETRFGAFMPYSIVLKFVLRFILSFGLSLLLCKIIDFIRNKKIKKVLLFIK